jgi:hypothetical protein
MSGDILREYLTRDELAKQLGKAVRTLERWEAARIGPPITRIGKTPMYRITAVAGWLKSLESKSPRRATR